MKTEVQDARSTDEVMICMEDKNMGILDMQDIVTATGGRILHFASRSFTGVCLDSRKIKPGELFIALKGERFDGHDFLLQALEKGSGAIVHRAETEPVEGKTLIYVKDTLKGLQDIAHFVRSRRDIPVIAVTGSNGKTTTKELIASVLGTTYKVMKNSGNLNNHIGLPLSLTRVSDDDQMIVLEMGASGPGEITELCTIAIPNYGVITNISPTHLEGFGDIETIRKTKLELLDSVSVAVVNADDLFLMEGVLNSGFKGTLISYGINNRADVYAKDIKLREKGSSLQLYIGGDRPIELIPKISGMFNIYNVLAAASVGYLFDIDPADMKDAIDSFSGVPMRLEFRDLDGIKVISDMYNANPASMEQALRELVRARRGRAIAVLGDMLELGTYEEEAHRSLGRLMSELAVDILIAVGQRMSLAAYDFRGTVYKFQTAEEAGKALRDIWRKGDTVLIKGSRGMRMERVLEA